MGENHDDGQGELQFDRAEFEGGASAPTTLCSMCQNSVGDLYYESEGKVVCAPCKERVEQAAAGGSGSGFGRFVRALVFGAIAAAAGALIYFAISWATDRQFGLVAILVGFMVGAAVRKGSRQRGGWLYQMMAVFLTYCSIVAAYTPSVVKGFLETFDEKKPELAAKAKSHGGLKDFARPAADLESSESVVRASSPTSSTAQIAEVSEVGSSATTGLAARAEKLTGTDADEAEADARLSPAMKIVALAIFAVVLAAASFASPILVGFQSPILLLIIGFALYEAWKINRRVVRKFSGPFRAGERRLQVLGS